MTKNTGWDIPTIATFKFRLSWHIGSVWKNLSYRTISSFSNFQKDGMALTSAFVNLA